MQQNPYESPAAASVETVRGSLVSRHKRIRWIGSGVVCTMPLISYLYVWLFWLLASVSLGEWAQPNIHDPKNFLSGIPHYISIILMMMTFAVAPLVFVFGYWRKKTIPHVLLYGVCLTATIVLWRLDLCQITTWIAD